jgi:hypothetical protein
MPLTPFKELFQLAKFSQSTMALPASFQPALRHVFGDAALIERA